MIGRILAGYSVEFANAIRIRTTYIGPVVVMATVVLATFQFPIARDTSSDFSYVAAAMPLAVDMTGVFVLLWYCASLISVDIGSGMIRLVLLSPLRRYEYFAAKLLMAWTYVLVLMTSAVVTSLALAYGFGELTGIYYGDQVVYTAGEMREAFLIALALNLPPLFAAAAFALMMSSLSGSRTLAIATTFSVWIALDLLKQPLQIQDYFFSTYLEHAWNVFSDRCNALPADWLPGAQFSLLTSLVWTIAACAIAVLALGRRDYSR